jgi:hypothetical protein
MDADVLVTRVSPLLSAKEIRALRCLSRRWRASVDSLLFFKGVFVPHRQDEPLPIEACRYLMSYGQRFTHVKEDDLIECAVLRGTLDDVKRLMSTRLSRSTNNSLLVFRKACAGGALNVVQWILMDPENTSALTVATDTVKFGFRFAASNGHLAICKLLKFHFSIPYDSVAFKLTCTQGNLDTGQWLVKVYGITRYNVSDHTDINFALGGACANGHLDVVKFLVETFDVEQHDVVGHNSGYALKFAVLNGHCSVVQYLVRRLKLYNLPFLHSTQLLKQLESAGRIDMLKFLVDELWEGDSSMAPSIGRM